MFTTGTVSPLEHLAAFAIVFVAAVLGTIAVGAYVETVREEGTRG